MYVVVGIIGIALSLGPSGGLFALFFRLFPPYQGLRVPSRAAILFLFAVAVLSAIGLTRVKRPRLRFALIGVAAAECFAGPLPWLFEPPAVPPIYHDVASLSEPGALLELPLPPPERFQDNARYVYRSIYHWRPLVNGYSGFVPPGYKETFDCLMRDTLSRGLKELRAKGVRFALVHTSRVGPRIRRQIQDAEKSALIELIASKGEDRLYRISAEDR
jgi:hypothetical protein